MRLKNKTNKLVVIFIIGALLIGFSLTFIDSIVLSSCDSPYIFCNVSALSEYEVELQMLPAYFSKLKQSFNQVVQNPMNHTLELFYSFVLISSLFYLLAKLLKWNEKRIIFRK